MTRSYGDNIIQNNKHGVYIARKYYLLLTKGLLRDKFIETFFKTIQEKKN